MVICLILFIILIVLCLVEPKNTVEVTNQTIFLWTKNVLPTLLPFFILSKYLLNSGADNFFKKTFKPFCSILGLPQSSAFCIFISILCGFPLGSIIVEDVFDDQKTKEYYANVCFSASSVFILSTVGNGILCSGKEGVALFTINFCTFLMFAVFTKPKNLCESTNYLKHSEPISESVTAIFNICGNMILFSLISSIFTRFIKNEFFKSIVSGIFEFTSGIKSLSALGFDVLPIISFFLSFGGLCVIFQCFGYLKKINRTKFILNRILCGSVSFILCCLYKKTALYMPILVTAFAITLCLLGRKNYYFLKSSRS